MTNLDRLLEKSRELQEFRNQPKGYSGYWENLSETYELQEQMLTIAVEALGRYCKCSRSSGLCFACSAENKIEALAAKALGESE